LASTSTRDGRYELRLAPGSYLFSVEVGELSLERELDVPEVPDFRFDLALPLGTLAGHVRDDAGNPLAGVTVDVVGGEVGTNVSARAKTDGRGDYRMELAPGRYQVAPRADDEEEPSFFEADERRVTMTAGAALSGVDFQLQLAGTMEGIVRLADGSVADGSSVDVVTDGAMWGVRQLGIGEAGARVVVHERSTRLVDMDEAGRFRIQPLTAGTYWLRASRFGSDTECDSMTAEPLAVVLASGAARTVELQLVPATRVAVRLRDASGATVDARLEAVDALGRAASAYYTSDRPLGFVLVPPGPYTLRALREDRLFEQELSLAAGACDVEVEVEFRLE
jgi:hypothetical protein